MKKIFISAMLVLLASQLLFAGKEKKGHLLIIGGHYRPMDVMKEFVTLCNGKPILIITSASGDPVEEGNLTINEFKEAGAVKIAARHIDSPGIANSDSMVALIDAAGGIFFTGGDQDVLMNRVGNSRSETALNRLYFERGGIIAGTSAGAAVMSHVMITGNELVNQDSTKNFFCIQAKNVETKRGFGFVENAIIDQHFMMRKRHNRLIAVVLEHPELPGIGIDEDTGILVYPDGSFRVYGKGAVIVYDARKTKSIQINDAGLLSAKNIKVDLLTHGDYYKIK